MHTTETADYNRAAVWLQAKVREHGLGLRYVSASDRLFVYLLINRYKCRLWIPI